MPPTTEIIGKSPILDREGRLVVLSAPELSWEAAHALWMWESVKYQEPWFNPKKYQIAILGHEDDVTSDLSFNLKNSRNGRPYDTLLTWDRKYDDLEWDLFTVNEERADSLYIVASVTTPAELEDVERVAEHCRTVLGVKMITGVFSFLGGSRQDKNVKWINNKAAEKYPGEIFQHENNHYVYEPRTSTIRTRMAGLAELFNRIMVIEPHSSALQAEAFKYKLPVLPISPWLWVGEQVVGDSYQDIVIIRPDEGRNLASQRFAGWLLKLGYRIGEVALIKARLEANRVQLTIKPGDIEKVRGKRCMVFDDEVATASTYGEIIRTLIEAQAIDLRALYVHGKFVGQWIKNLTPAFLSEIVGTNSRHPLGKIAHLGDRHRKLSLAPFVLELIQADVQGTDYWCDSRYQQMILQTHPSECAEA